MVDPCITTIVGPSDVGKSAIIRALRWLVFNRPAGEGFIRDGADTVEVIVELPEDGGPVTVRREKGKRNLYTVNDTEYAAFGNDVPEPVSRALNLSSINFQRQHDSPFWFSETAGEVSRQLNSIIDLGIIDTTLANLASVVRSSKMEVDVAESRLAEAIELRRKLKPAHQMNKDLLEVETLFSKEASLSIQVSSLKREVEEARKYKALFTRYSKGLRVARLVLEKGENLKDCIDKETVLKSLIALAKDLALKASQPIPNLTPLIKKAEGLRDQQTTIEILQTLITDVSHQRTRECEARKTWKQVQSQLTVLMGTMCPLCGQKM